MSTEFLQGLLLGLSAGASVMAFVAAIMINNLAYRKNGQIRAAYQKGIDDAVTAMRRWHPTYGHPKPNIIPFPGGPKGAA